MLKYRYLMKDLVIELRKGILSWHYVIKSKTNGQILSTSEVYFSHSNAIRAARKLGEVLSIDIKE